MLKIESREAANLKSRVKDLSQVPNLVNFAGLFACITPLAKVAPNEAGLYEPVLIRDVNSLIGHFGDPRIDPERYVDLYSIMQMVGDGSSCYVARVASGTTGTYPLSLGSTLLSGEWVEVTGDGITDNTVYELQGLKYKFDLVALSKHGAEIIPLEIISEGEPKQGTNECLYTVTKVVDPNDSTNVTYTLRVVLGTALENNETLVNAIGSEFEAPYMIKAFSALTDDVTLNVSVMQAKPFSIGAYYLTIEVVNNGNTLATSKIKLSDDLTNKGLTDALTSLLNPYVAFELYDDSHKDACISNDERDYSIVGLILDLYAPIEGTTRRQLSESVVIPNAQGEHDGEGPKFLVTLNDYIDALNQYKDKKYTGCIMADLVAPLTHIVDLRDSDKQPTTSDNYNETFGVPTPDERRTLHFWMKQIACERKDVNVILSVPLINNDNHAVKTDNMSPEARQAALNRYSGDTKMSFDEVCNWVSSNGSFSDLWEYGHTDTTDYADQSFYLEIYFSWLTMNCIKLEDGIAKSAVVQLAPAGPVAQCVLHSYRERGTHLPVAGDQGGTLPSAYSVIVNPKTKAERDQLVQYRINPIYDTGTRGVQIYGNETLNAGYTDLNAAHIARELVNIRSRIDEYTETLKFMLNNTVLWDTWMAYVSSNILEPAKSINAIKDYEVAMGYETTTPEELANRMVKGQVSLQFFQSAEIFDLTFTVFSTSAETLG